MTTIISISLTETLKKFLDDNPALSPSKVMQSALIDIMEKSKTWKSELDEMIRKKQFFAERSAELQEFIESKGYWKDYLQWRLDTEKKDQQ